VIVALVSPEGFVSDYASLNAGVIIEPEAVQFTLTGGAPNGTSARLNMRSSTRKRPSDRRARST
jgi:hypothetical protein